MVWKHVKTSFDVLMNEGLGSFTYKVRRKFRRKFHALAIQLAGKLKEDEEKKRPSTVRDFLDHANGPARPIPFLKVQSAAPRFNMVTDSVKRESLFGGVATSLILATLFANKQNMPLRIISRTTENSPQDYEEFLRLMNIPRPKQIEFFSDYKSKKRLEVSNQDVFLSTSWWSSKAIQALNQRPSFFYLLQEVELFFYPHGDEHLQCRTVLEEPNIHYLINTQILRDFYRSEGFANVSSRSTFFEPAFPKHLYAASEKTFGKKEKRNLFFYSRPKNARNLFKTGLEILDEALLTGIIDEKEWNIYFAGAYIPDLTFSNGSKPKILSHMSWQRYIEFTKTIDLCFSLMYTPHPSYPPLDIAASGGVVLTNQYPGKEKLPYSRNIFCEPLDKKSMLAGFEKAVALANNSEERLRNYETHQIERDWGKALAPTLEYMAEHL